MSIKNFLFPFSGKRVNLDKSIWHRLAVVIFFVGILIFLGWSWFAIMNFEYSPTKSCVDAVFASNSYDIDHCFELSKVHHIRDIFIALGLTLLASYLIQVIYFKVFLYIILGKNNNDIS